MSFFADFTYEGSRSIIGPYLGLLGASVLAVAVVTGFGEFLGYALRLFSGRGADRTGRYWPITISGYVLQMSVVPLLALAGSWQVAAILIIPSGSAGRSGTRPVTRCSRTRPMGSGTGGPSGCTRPWTSSARCSAPSPVALVLSLSHHDYKLTFAALAVPTLIMWSLLGAARVLYPRPQDLEPITDHITTEGMPRAFWIYLAGAALVAAGFADFPIVAYHFQQAGTVSTSLTAVFYGVAMAVSGTGSLVFGRLFDRAGIGILIPLTVVAALYAPLVFLGGFWPSLVGISLWGLGMGVHESIIPAAVGPMVSANRRASAYGLFTAGYGISWFLGSTVIGALFGVSLGAVVAFAVVTQFAAIPLIVLVQRHTAPRRRATQ